jgi:hypothetical protein
MHGAALAGHGAAFLLNLIGARCCCMCLLCFTAAHVALSLSLRRLQLQPHMRVNATLWLMWCTAHIHTVLGRRRIQCARYRVALPQLVWVAHRVCALEFPTC